MRNMVTTIPFLIARITDDNDFLRLKELANNSEGWHLEYEKTALKIWSRVVPDGAVKMFKVWAIFSGINSLDLYNSLMDPIYRKQWDSHVIVTYDIGYLNHNNLICYYAASCPPPLRSRDFVLQSSWLDRNNEYFMLNHSVCHKDHPPRPGFIRAISYFTGYYIKSMVDAGSEMTFVTQTDPQGFIPAWLVNKCTQIFAPRFVRHVEKAATAYKAWKIQNNPEYLPWVHPEQMKSPKISVSDCVPSAEEKQSNFYRNLMEKSTKQQSDLIIMGTTGFYGVHASIEGPSRITYANIEHKSVQNLHAQVQDATTQMRKKGKQKKGKTNFWLDQLQENFETISRIYTTLPPD